MKEISLIIFSLALVFSSCSQVSDPKPMAVVPSEKQIAWQQLEYYAFIHFGPNTFTGVEWGNGEEDPTVFNPTELDCEQWARVCKDAGMKAIVLTAKHHDGFCLWPSGQSAHTVRESLWKDGRGDVVKMLAEACRKYGLKFGVYLSPWDMNHPSFTTNRYNDVYVNSIKEVLTSYGDIFEFWYDGGIGKNGKRQIYDWDKFDSTIRSLQPQVVINGCRHLRWVGNEDGYAPETCWSTISRDSVHAANIRADGSVLNLYGTGLENGDTWAPAECDVSIRPGWFYHPKDDGQVKTLPQLADIYMKSVGHNATLILNLAPDRRGLIPQTEVDRLMALRRYLDRCFAGNLLSEATAEATSTRGNRKYHIKNVTDGRFESYWATGDSVSKASATFTWNTPQQINAVVLSEYIALGQRVKAFNIEVFENNAWRQVAKGTTIGYKKIVTFDRAAATSLRINITDNREAITISEIGAYLFPDLVTEPVIARDKDGYIKITSGSQAANIYYTTDGTEPTASSTRYEKPLRIPESVMVKAKVFVNDDTEYSNTITMELPASKQGWKIIDCDSFESEQPATNAIDEEPSTFWVSSKKSHPHFITIDMGKEQLLTGFTYLPCKETGEGGKVSVYSFFVSSDAKKWECVVDRGKFDNIANNPVMQYVWFDNKHQARYIKFVSHNDSRSLENDVPQGIAVVAEIGVFTGMPHNSTELNRLK